MQQEWTARMSYLYQVYKQVCVKDVIKYNWNKLKKMFKMMNWKYTKINIITHLTAPTYFKCV